MNLLGLSHLHCLPLQESRSLPTNNYLRPCSRG